MSKSNKVSYFNVVMPLAREGKVLEKSFVRMSLTKGIRLWLLEA